VPTSFYGHATPNSFSHGSLSNTNLHCPTELLYRPMGCCASTANVPSQDPVTESAPVRSVAPLVPVSIPPPPISEPSSASLSRTRNRTQSAHRLTYHSKESPDLSQCLRTASAPDKVQPTRSSSSQPSQGRRTRAQTLDTRGRDNRSGPSSPSPGKSRAWLRHYSSMNPQCPPYKGSQMRGAGHSPQRCGKCSPIIPSMWLNSGI